MSVTRRAFCGLVARSVAGASLLARHVQAAPQLPADPASLDDLFGNGAPALRKLIDQLIPAPLSAHRRNRAMSRRRHY